MGKKKGPAARCYKQRQQRLEEEEDGAEEVVVAKPWAVPSGRQGGLDRGRQASPSTRSIGRGGEEAVGVAAADSGWGGGGKRCAAAAKPTAAWEGGRRDPVGWVHGFVIRTGEADAWARAPRLTSACCFFRTSGDDGIYLVDFVFFSSLGNEP